MTSALARMKTMLLIGLGSDHDGERAATMRKVETLLKAEGMDAHWLAGQLATEDPYEQVARRRAERREREDEEQQHRRQQRDEKVAGMRPQDRARRPGVLDKQKDRLTDREIEFLQGISRRWTDLTVKQLRWLDDILARMR